MATSTSSRAGPSRPRRKQVHKLSKHDQNHWAVGDLKPRFRIWHGMTDPAELATFHSTPTPGYNYTAKDAVHILKENCTAAKIQRLDNIKKRLEATAFYREDDIDSQDLIADPLELGRRLRTYLARLDHDFFFGLLSDPEKLGEGYDWHSTGQSFDVQVIDGCNPAVESRYGSWSPIEKQIKLWTKFSPSLPKLEGCSDEVASGRGKGKNKAEVVMVTHKFHGIVQQLTYQLCHVFLDVMGYYPADAEATRQAEVAKDDGHGEQFFILYNFIMEHLAGWAPDVQVYAREALIYKSVTDGSRHVHVAQPEQHTAGKTDASRGSHAVLRSSGNGAQSSPTGKSEALLRAKRNNNMASDTNDKASDPAKELRSNKGSNTSESSDNLRKDAATHKNNDGRAGANGKSKLSSTEAHRKLTPSQTRTRTETKDKPVEPTETEKSVERTWQQFFAKYWFFLLFCLCPIEILLKLHFGVDPSVGTSFEIALGNFALRPVVNCTIVSCYVAVVFRVFHNDNRAARTSLAVQILAALLTSQFCRLYHLEPAAFGRLRENEAWFVATVQTVIILIFFRKGMTPRWLSLPTVEEKEEGPILYNDCSWTI